MDQSVPSDTANDLFDQLRTLLDERLDVESLASVVEQINFNTKLSEKLQRAFQGVRSEIGWTGSVVGAIQQEIRDLILDVGLLKRAVASLGQVGVMERRRIERELVLELLPPMKPRPGAGLHVHLGEAAAPRRVDCASRLHLCKAACCRIFSVALTPPEVESDRYDWDPRHPYELRREPHGCVHLRPGGCTCSLYGARPGVCRNYSCEKDGRIWADFENMILNPELAKRLEALDVSTAPVGMEDAVVPAMATKPDGDRTIAERSAAPQAVRPDPAPDGPRREATSTEGPPPVAAPNFDDLRALIIPQPGKRFVPPSSGSNHN